MLTEYANKMLKSPEIKSPGDFQMVTDGTLGGCGYGPVGDPRTFTPELWAALLDQLRPLSVLDIGCGFGYSTRWFAEHDVKVVGLEGSETIVSNAVSPYVVHHDFTHPHDPFLDQFDLGWTCEFLEHVEAQFEENIFRTLRKCRYIAMTAALPGHSGHHHVNCQPLEYWIGRFKEHGFGYVPEMTEYLRGVARTEAKQNFFSDNGMFFERCEEAPTVTKNEREELLCKLSKGKRVLAIHAYDEDINAMSETAKQVTVVGALITNARPSKTEHIEKHVSQCVDELSKRRFDLIYVDGNPVIGTSVAVTCLLPGGMILWNNFTYDKVKEAIVEAGIPIEHVRTSDNFGLMLTGRNQVAIAMPHSGNAGIDSVKSAWQGCEGRYADKSAFMDNNCGGLTHNFNTILGHALNWRDKGVLTHLAMIHSDVTAPSGWIDVLSEEQCLTRALVISAVVAIKDPDDDRTSTAVGSVGDPWEPVRYIRNRDHGRIPDTFVGSDVCGDGEVLLINTGCMLIDLRHDFWDSFCFRVYDRIIMKNGLRYPQFRPEDWEMSRELHAAGLPYASTFKVKTKHHGGKAWENRPGLGMLTNAD